jgi:(p)ppGpp synthase/HD superfamily hydrolase
MNQLARAIRIAAEAHETQLDKAGEPYVLHVLRVVLGCQSPDAQTVAALHDVVEDTDWTFARLRDEGFDATIVAAVDAMTRREGEEYLDFVRRAIRNPLARAVKRADLLDNMNMARIAAPTARDQERYQRYAQALALLDAEEAAGAGAEATP